MSQCSLCHEEITGEAVYIPTMLSTPEGEQVVFHVCPKCNIIIGALSGGDKLDTIMENYQNVIDIMLTTLVALENMLAVDFELGHDDQPRKMVREDLDQWVNLASFDLASRRP